MREEEAGEHQVEPLVLIPCEQVSRYIADTIVANPVAVARDHARRSVDGDESGGARGQEPRPQTVPTGKLQDRSTAIEIQRESLEGRRLLMPTILFAGVFCRVSPLTEVELFVDGRPLVVVADLLGDEEVVRDSTERRFALSLMEAWSVRR